MKIFLVVLYDRHCDDAYRAAQSLDGAKRLADALMADYGSRYEWQARDDVETWTYLRDVGFDDGPHLHIEEVELQP